MPHKKITVMGTSGYVGSNLRRVAEAAYPHVEIVPLARHDLAPLYGDGGSGEEDTLSDHGASIRDSPGLDGILSMIRGSDALVNLAGAGYQSAAAPFEYSIVRTAALADSLCQMAGIPTIVYVSGLGASRHSPIAYLAAKYRAEMATGTGRESKKEEKPHRVILRPSYIVGRGDQLSEYVRQYDPGRGSKASPALDIFECSGLIQPIHIDDAASVILWAAIESSQDTTLDVVGPDRVPFYDYMRMLAKAAGVPVNPVTMEEAYLQALQNPKSAMFGVDDLGIILGGFVGDHQKLARTTGVVPRSVVNILESGRLS